MQYDLFVKVAGFSSIAVRSLLRKRILTGAFILILIPYAQGQSSGMMDNYPTIPAMIKLTESIPNGTPTKPQQENQQSLFPLSHQKGHSPLLLTRTAFLLSGGWDRYNETFALNASHGSYKPFAEAIPEIQTFPITPLQQRLNKNTCRDSVLVVSSLHLQGKNNRRREKELVNYLLGNFISGIGPENTLFKEDSEVCHFIRDARIIKTAFRNYLGKPSETNDSSFYCIAIFRLPDLIATLAHPLSVRHFVGSAEILISESNDSLLLVTVMNTTSITSADFTTHLKKQSRWPVSRQRCTSPGPLSNTSQVFQLRYTRDEMMKMAGRKYH
jgi:hypothetical protein